MMASNVAVFLFDLPRSGVVNMQVDALKHLQGAEALGYTFYIYHFLTQNYFAGKIKQNIWKCLILRDKKK